MFLHPSLSCAVFNVIHVNSSSLLLFALQCLFDRTGSVTEPVYYIYSLTGKRQFLCIWVLEDTVSILLVPWSRGVGYY